MTKPALPGSVISVRGLSLKYGRGATGVLALSNISFSMAEGEFIAVVGPSGCGKSIAVPADSPVKSITTSRARRSG